MHTGRWRLAQATLLSTLLVGGTAAAAPVITLVVAVIDPAAIDAPMVVGLDRGMFEKYGLRIEARAAASGFEAIRQVADGTAQIAAAGSTAVSQTIGRGARLRAVAASNGDATGRVPTDSYVAVVARDGAGIPEGHLEGLRGKKVGVRLGSDFHQYLFSALAANGLDPAAGAATIVDTPDPLGMLRAGLVDAVVAPEPAASRIQQQIPGAVIVQRGGNYMQFLELRVVSAEYLATHPGTVKRYVTAFAEAAQFVRKHPDETADIMTRRQFKGLPRALVRTAIGLLHADVRISKVTARAAEAGSDFALRIGALKRAPAFEEMFDLRILRQVERERPHLFSDLPPITDAQKL